MAFDISPKLIEEYNFNKKPFLNILIKLWSFRAKLRGVLRIFYLVFYKNKKFFFSSNSLLSIVTLKLKDSKDIFNKNGYIYFENILEGKFHTDLIRSLPPKFFFMPPRHISKQYNFGFFWLGGKIENIKYIKNFYYLECLYKYLVSQDFCNKINELCGDGIVRKAVNLNLTYLESNSILFAHKDSIANPIENNNIEMRESSLNCLFFLTGNDSVKNSGKTILYEYNEYKNIIFEPKTLNNSLLIYKSSSKFYHGFPKTDKGAFRYSVNIQYCEDEFASKY